MSLRSTPKLVTQLCSLADELEYIQDIELGLRKRIYTFGKQKIKQEKFKNE
mgnify:CR=1 FL=1